MGRAPSLDLRSRVLKASAEGMSGRQSAARFGAGISSAIRCIARARIGELAPRPQGRRRASSDWDETIQGAFFTEGDNPSLVEESEITTNWEALSDEQKEVVRSHCETVDTAAASTANGTTGTTGTTGSTATDSAASGATTGSSSASTGGTSAGTAADTDTTASTAAGSDSTTGTASASNREVAEADIQQLCSHVMTMN